jgi:two-component system response regulator RegX3
LVNIEVMVRVMKLLLAGADEELLEVLSFALTHRGYKIRTVVPESLADASDDFLVLDLPIPAQPVRDVLRQVRARTGLPCLVLSARPLGAAEIEAAGLHPQHIVYKPFLVAHLASRIEDLHRRAVGEASHARDCLKQPSAGDFGEPA